jgi:hypothetical protein
VAELLSLRNAIAEVLSDGRSYTIEGIHDEIRRRDLANGTVFVVGSTLAQMARQPMVERVAPGVYKATRPRPPESWPAGAAAAAAREMKRGRWPSKLPGAPSQGD